LENGHNDIITCLALDVQSQDMLISGAKDGSIVHWSAILKNSNSSSPPTTPLIGKPYRLLSIHYDAVRIIAINSKVGIVVSAADDGTIALYSIARKRFVRQLLFEGRDNEDNDNINIHEVVQIHISDTGYIVIHSIDDTIPYLRVMSINGILIKKVRLHEILFVIKTDSTSKILITGGQACKVVFRHIHNLQVIQEITILDKEKTGKNKNKKRPSKLIKKPNQSKKINCNSICGAMLNNKTYSKLQVSHSSAWRQQRFLFNHAMSGSNNSRHSRNSSINDELFGQRKSMLNDKKNHSKHKAKNKSKSKRNSSSYHHDDSPRISTHFHGRFASVDGHAILSQSRIIDFDLDPDNTYMIIVFLNLNLDPAPNKAQLLLYALPNSRHIREFDKFVHGTHKVLQTAKNTIWENIINVIHSENGLNELNTFSFPSHIPNVSDLYFKDNASSGHSANPSSKAVLVETGKSLISKIKQKTTNKFTLSQSVSNKRKPLLSSDASKEQNDAQQNSSNTANNTANNNQSHNTDSNGNHQDDTNNNINNGSNEDVDYGNVIADKFSALKSLWKKQ